MVGTNAIQLLDNLIKIHAVTNKIINSLNHDDIIRSLRELSGLKDCNIHFTQLCKEELSLEEQNTFNIDKIIEMILVLYEDSDQLLGLRNRSTSGPYIIDDGGRSIIVDIASNINSYIKPLIQYIDTSIIQRGRKRSMNEQPDNYKPTKHV